jgi:hypothetical protein
MFERRLPTNTMTPQRVQALLKLVEESNTGYFLVSGGGEGFLELPLMYQIIEGSTADVTWMVSSGFWAVSKQNARNVINNCYAAHMRGNSLNPNRETIIRISIDKNHIDLIGSPKNPFGYVRNIVQVFEQTYANSSHFSLLLHSLEGEEYIIKKLAKELGASIHTNIDVNHSDVKITESAMLLHLTSGFKLPVTFAKLLLSDIAVDLRDKELLAKRLKIWETDAYVNEQNRTGLQVYDNGFGNDMLVIYDGRVAGGWQCEMPDVPINIDDHDYAEIMRLTLSDPGVLATLEKGQRYRFSVIEEANPKACIRAKAVNVRDYTSPTILEEDRDKLYFTIRAIQDYHEEGRLKDKEMTLPPDIIDIINTTPEQLRSWYHDSTYDIIAQFREFNQGFHKFEVALLDFIKNGDEDIFINRILESGNYDFRRIDQWYNLLLRIHHEWYSIKSWKNEIIESLKKIIMLIEQQVLKGIHPFEGLSWQSLC